MTGRTHRYEVTIEWTGNDGGVTVYYAVASDAIPASLAGSF